MYLFKEAINVKEKDSQVPRTSESGLSQAVGWLMASSLRLICPCQGDVGLLASPITSARRISPGWATWKGSLLTKTTVPSYWFSTQQDDMAPPSGPRKDKYIVGMDWRQRIASVAGGTDPSATLVLRPYNEYDGKSYSGELLLWTPGFAAAAGSAKCGG